MDSQTTTPTLISRDIRVLHLEPTDVCQARCPLCARETDVEFDRRRQNHLTIEQILKHFPNESIKNLDKMFMCGIYGDPAAGKHTMDIYNYFRLINSTVVLGMNSNGAIQTTFWWHALGKLFNQPLDYVVFSIDGLEDTNQIYRRGVDWKKLIANAEAFINAGGSAHWDMLVYRHNQHQVDECEQLARKMGFKWFRAKVSKRPFINGLEFPIGWKQSTQQPGTINCHALNEKSMYIDARGVPNPCCWLGGKQNSTQHDFTVIQQQWNSDPNTVCRDTCGTNTSETSFTAQWQREICLD